MFGRLAAGYRKSEQILPYFIMKTTTMPKHTFSMRDLRAMLGDLGTLAVSPEGRRLIAEFLEERIRRSRIGGPLLDKLRIMYTYFRDPAEPLKPKLLIGAALVYLIMPGDLLPDWFGLIGFTDDIAALTFVWNQLRSVLMHYEERRQQRQAILEDICTPESV